MVMVDTDIIIWILRGSKEIKDKFTSLVKQTDGLIYLTPIQIAEIYAGLREKEKSYTEIFLDTFANLSINKKIGKLAGEFMNKYSKSHNVLVSDALIAASVKIHGLKLWTLNKKHYPMLKKEEFFQP